MFDELSEGAARIVDFFRFLVTPREKCLVECNSAGGVDLDQTCDSGRNVLDVAHEREASAVRDERAGIERQLDLAIERIAFAAELPRHDPPRFTFAPASCRCRQHDGSSVGASNTIAEGEMHGRVRKKPAAGFHPIHGLRKVMAPWAGLEPAT